MSARVGLGMRTFFALVFALLSAAVSAQSSTIEWVDNSSGGPYINTSPDVLCENATQRLNPGSGYSGRARTPWNGAMPSLSAACEFHGTGSYVLLGVTVVARCSNGGTWNSTTSSCQGSNPCADKTGQTSIENYTTGWGRTNDPNSPMVSEIPLPRDGACDGQCLQAYGGVVACWRSQVPAASGLHRISCDARMTYTGTQCTSRTPSNDPSTPEPPCPGFTGSVNGRPVCVGTDAHPLPSVPTPAGVPPEGTGNPASGQQPSTGPGSGSTGTGRTPAVGSGGNEGGGSNAAIPGGGSEGNGQGTGTAQPVNSNGSGGTGGGSGSSSGEPTPIDEAGMPSGAGAYDSATAAVNANRDAAVNGINSAAGTAGKNTGWSFVFAFPTGCSEIPLAGFAPYISGVNICSYQGTIHDLMSLIWLAVTVFCCIGMVGRAVGGGSQ